MTKVMEYCRFYEKMERSDTITLGTLDHFRHFRHFFSRCVYYIQHFADDPIDVFVCDLAGTDPFMPAPAVI